MANQISGFIQKPYVRIAIIYLVISVVWILLSDKIASSLSGSVITLQDIQNAKGIFFVVMTTLMIYFLIRNDYKIISKKNKELEHSLNFYLKLFDKFPNPIWKTDNKGSFDFFNQAWYEFVGSDSFNNSDKVLFKYLHDEDKEIFLESFTNKFAEKQDFSFTHRLINRNKKYRWVKIFGSPFYDAYGNFLGYIGTFLDIHELVEANRIIKRDEERLSLALEAANDGLWDWDLDKDYIYWSPRAFKMLGYEPDEFVVTFEKWKKLIHPDECELVWESIQEQIKSANKSFDIEFRYECKNGNWLWVRGRGKVVQLKENGKIKRFSGTQTDISERKNIEENLRKSEQTFRAFMSNIPGFAYIKDKERKHQYLNPPLIEYFKSNEKKCLGKTFEEIIPGAENSESIKDNDLTIFNTSQPIQFEEKIIRGGDAKTFLSIKFPIKTDNEVSMLGGISIDISEKKIIQEKLHESQQKLTKIINSSPLPIISISNDGLVTSWNNAAEKVFGWRSDEVLGKSIPIISLNKEKEFNFLKERVFTGESFQGIEIIRKNKNGDDINLSLSTAPLTDSRGNITGIMGIFENIEERKKAENLLKSSEERYKSIFNNSHAVMLIVDPYNGKIIDANPSACNYYGFTIDELKNMHLEKLNLLTDSEIQKEMMEAKTEKKHYFVFKHKLAGGEIRDVEVYSGPISFGDKNYLFSIVHDITERKTMEKMLIESELKYKTVADYTYDWEYWIDVDGKYNYISPSCEKITGYLPEEFIADPDLKLKIVHPDDHHVLAKHHEEDFNISKSACEFEFRIITKDGITKWISHVCRSVIDNNGAFRGRRGTNRDITLQKNAQLNLIESQQKISAIIQNADALIFTSDKKRVLTLCEGKALSQLDLLPENLLNHPVEILFGKSDIIDKLFLKALAGESAYDMVKIQDYYFDLSVVPQFDADNNQIGIIGLAVDITNRVIFEKQLEEYKQHLETLVDKRTKELANVNKQLADELEKQKAIEETIHQALSREKELNELKSRFISTTSHEFRTPLTSIFSSAELLEMYGRRWEENKYKEHLGKIKLSVDYLTNLLDDILILSRAESGRTFLEISDFNLAELCKNLIEEVKALTKENQIVLLTYNAESEYYNLDKKLIRFILNNLLTNAVKYSSSGDKVNLTVTSDSERVYFEVTDSGIGIPDDEINSIFEPFYRAKNTGATRGNGLGLSIVHKSIEIHHGQITVKSKIDEGTIFKVVIPVKNYIS